MPLLNKNRATLPSPTNDNMLRKIRVIVIALKRDTMTPMPSVNAKPLISDVPNQKSMSAVMKFEIFESRIENQAREKPNFTASLMVRPARSSSLIRSKISTFASTAIPIDMMNPAIPAAVRVTGMSLKSAKIIAINIQREIVATSPGKRYQRIRNNATSKKPIIVAFTPAWTALSPRVAPIVCVESKAIGTGRAPEFKRPTSCFASVGVKLPEITACPFGISSRTIGVDIGAPSR